MALAVLVELPSMSTRKGDELIPTDAELATEKLNDMAIKGTIHEFGHAPGLPHISPRPEVDLGNSLMGPVNRDYWSRSGSDDVRVYLTQASAFALCKHPIFRKQRTPNPSYPREMKFENLQFKEADDEKNILVTGSLKSSDPAHSAIVYDSECRQIGDYFGPNLRCADRREDRCICSHSHLTSQQRIVISLLQSRIGNQYIGRTEATPKGQFDFGSVCWSIRGTQV